MKKTSLEKEECPTIYCWFACRNLGYEVTHTIIYIYKSRYKHQSFHLFLFYTVSIHTFTLSLSFSNPIHFRKGTYSLDFTSHKLPKLSLCNLNNPFFFLVVVEEEEDDDILASSSGGITLTRTSL